MINLIKRIIHYCLQKIYGSKADNLIYLLNVNDDDNLFYNKNRFSSSHKGDNTKLYSPYKITDSQIGDYTYISPNSIVKHSFIGKFCSIGPNFTCGWGVHPTNGISTSPMFYSSKKQNGVTLSEIDKIKEIKPITIGHDVFIGMNVTVLDGVTIGNGAIIGAGSVVSKDIPPYAIAVGSPIKVINYRFDEEIIDKLLEIKWWDWEFHNLNEVESDFFNIDVFIQKHYTQKNQ